MHDCQDTDYVVNFSSYASQNPEIIDNSGLMLLKLLVALGIQEVCVAGMDGYSAYSDHDYFDRQLEYDFSREAEKRNQLISEEIHTLQKLIQIHFITKTCYSGFDL